MFLLYPCPVCGEPGRYRSWEPDIVYDEKGRVVHSSKEVCLVCAKRGPRWLRLMWCWLDDKSQLSRQALVGIGVGIFVLGYVTGIVLLSLL